MTLGMPTRTWQRAATAVGLAATLAMGTFGIGASQHPVAAADCGAVDANLTALGLGSTPITTPDGIAMIKWSGMVASWDGVPLSVDVSLPAAGECMLPTIMAAHGYAQDKTFYESATAANTSTLVDQYNNVAWVARGYAVLTYTARGLHDSCGPAVSSDGTASGLPAACTANGRHYWIDFDDMRYAVRDAQWLIGRLVDAGVVDPGHIGVTGGSMGGGLSWLMTMLNDRVMCGGVAWSADNGADPCAGKASGATVPWTSQNGVGLHVAAAVPEYAWADLLTALLPNGRASDGLYGAPTPAGTANPIGIPARAWAANLYNSGHYLGFFAPAGVDTTADWGTWLYELATQQVNTQTAGQGTTLGADMRNFQNNTAFFRSLSTPYWTFDANVPVLQVQGLEDTIFPMQQATLAWSKATRWSASYPIATMFGDVGHQLGLNPASEWTAITARANAFFDYYLRNTGAAPTFDTSAWLIGCSAATSATPVQVAASSPGDLAPATLSLTSTTTTTVAYNGGSAEGAATGPNSTSTTTKTNHGCPIMAQATDAGEAAYTWTAAAPYTLLGNPTAALKLRTTGSDAELNARLWNLTPDGQQTFISRGSYRLAIAPSATDTTVSFEVDGSAWAVPQGDQLKLEITANDMPSRTSDTVPSTTTIDSVTLNLPIAAPAG